MYEKLAAPVQKLVEDTRDLVEKVLFQLVSFVFKDYTKLGKAAKSVVSPSFLGSINEPRSD